MTKTRSRTPRLDFDALKSVADFGTVLEHYDAKGELSLKGTNSRNGQISMHCPFHDDQTPSLSVNRDKGVFNCHASGCGRSGNVLDFVLAMEVMAERLGEDDIREAAMLLAAIVGFSENDQRPPAKPRRASPGSKRAKPRPNATTAALDASAAAEKASEPELATNKPLSAPFLERFQATLDFEHLYLEERGLDPATARGWGIGFQTAGAWQNRVVIPITNVGGAVLAYAGRWALGDETIPPGEGKYKLPKAQLFNKKLALFSHHRVTRSRHLTVVEGYFGAIRLQSLGLPAVALMGNSISIEQVDLLIGLGLGSLEAITVMLDGGPHNQAMTDRALGVIARYNPNFRVRALTLPEGEQPDTVAEGWLIEHYPSLQRRFGLSPEELEARVRDDTRPAFSAAAKLRS